VEVQVATARTGAPGNKLDAGLCSFDDTAFTVDADGYVSLAGGLGPAIDSIDVDFNTAPGTDPVVPSGTGVVSVFGNVVTNGTNAAAPVATHSRAANQLHIDVQLATAVTGAPGDNDDVGLCSFDDTMFTVDGNGFVQLIGGGLAFDSITVDNVTGPGVNPVVPSGAGLVTIAGAAVAAHSIPIETHSRAVNAYNVEVQYATTAATTTAADSGICHFKAGEFVLDANGFVTLGAAGKSLITVNNGAVANLGFTLSTQTLTVHAADGTALSTSNPGFVFVEDPANAGQFKTIEVTANQVMVNTEMDGNTFGITSGVDWGQDLPLYVYAMTNDSSNAIAFAIGRVPNLVVSPAAANIGDPSAANADIEMSLYSFDDITEAEWDANPVVCLGSLRATWGQASTRWTFTATDSEDGLGRFNESREFVMPVGQNGADAAGYFELNGGTTIPVFTTNAPKYYVSRNGRCDLNVFHNGDGGQDGAGAVTMYWCAPYLARTTGVNDTSMGFGQINAAAGGIQVSAQAFQTDADHRIQLDRSDTGSSTNLGDWTNGARYWEFDGSYMIGR